MPPTFQISRDSEALFITLVTKNRLPAFKTDTMKAVLCKAIDEARTSGGFLLFAYVLMPDHTHVLTNKPKTAADVLRVLKGITARRVIDYLKEKTTFPHFGSFSMKSRNGTISIHCGKPKRMCCPFLAKGMFMQKVNYIHLNPVRANIVDTATEYRWSSARIWQRCPLEDEPLRVDFDRIRWRTSR